MLRRLALIAFTAFALIGAAHARLPKGSEFNSLPQAARPTFSPVAGPYTAPQNVIVSSTTPGGVNRCTTDGSLPTPATAACSVPEVINGANETLCAIDFASGYTPSPPRCGLYQITTQAATPTANPPGGPYTVTKNVALTCTSPSPSMYFTLNGAQPDTSSTPYTTPIAIAVNTTLKAVCTSPGLSTSGVLTAVYTINEPGDLDIITPAALPLGEIGVAYSTTLQASGGTPPYTWSMPVTSPPSYYSSDQKAPNGTFHTPVPQNVWSLSSSGVLTSTPAGAETDYFLVRVTDSASLTTTAYLSAQVGTSTNRIVITTPISLGNIAQGTTYTTGSPLSTVNAVGGVSTFTYSLVSQTGLNSWAVDPAGGITGTATHLGTDSITVESSDGTNSRQATLYVTVNTCVTSCSRPAGNTGAGFFVSNGEIYDANGNIFRCRGYNRSHYDDTAPGANWGANCVRYTLYYTGVSESQLVTDFTTQHLDAPVYQVVISSRHYDQTGGTPSGSTNLGLQTGANASGMGTMVTDWVNAFPAYNSAVMNKVIINIANEWGPDTAHTGGQPVINYQYAYAAALCPVPISIVAPHTIHCATGGATNPYANSLGLTIGYLTGAGSNSNGLINISSVGGSSGDWTVVSTNTLSAASAGNLCAGAVGILRCVGYTAPLMIDAGQYGQGYPSLANYSAAIFNSDPQKNIIFDYHVYGGTTNLSTLTSGMATWSALRTANGMAFMLGEFGPYLYPSSASSITQIPTAEIVNAAESFDMGYTAWALDNYTTYAGTSSQSDDNEFTMKYQDADANGLPSNRTQFGKYLSMDPVQGFDVLATPASSLIGLTPILSMPTYTNLYGNTYVSGANGAISPTRGQTQIAPKNLPPGAVYPLAERANPYSGAGNDTYYWPNTWTGAGTMTGFSPANAAGHSQLSIQPQGNSPTTTFQMEGAQFGAYMLGSDAYTSSGRPQFTLQQNFFDNPISGQPSPGPVLFTGSTVVLHNSITLAAPTWVGAGSSPDTTNSPYIQIGLGLIPTPVPSPRSWELDIFINILAGSAENSAVHGFFLTQGPPDSYSIVIPFGASPNTYTTYISGTYQTGSFSTPINFSWTISYSQMTSIISYMCTTKGFTAFCGLVPEDFTLFQAHINAEQPNISTISMGWNTTGWSMSTSD